MPPAPRARGLTTRLRHNRPFSLSPLGSNQKCNAASSKALHSKTLMDCRHCIMLRATHGFLRLLQVVATAQRFIVLTFLNHCLALRLDCSTIQKRIPRIDEDTAKMRRRCIGTAGGVLNACHWQTFLCVGQCFFWHCLGQYFGTLQLPQAFNGAVQAGTPSDFC